MDISLIKNDQLKKPCSFTSVMNIVHGCLKHVKEVKKNDAKDNETWYLWDLYFGHDVEGHGRKQFKHGQVTIV
jgi:hypothetical protein